jgi:cytochrome c oxidase subunit 3
MILNSTNRLLFQFFSSHLVQPSPWPFYTSFVLLGSAIGAVMSMHGYPYGSELLAYNLFLTLLAMSLWFRDIIIEGTLQGHHTKKVVKGFVIGIALFILSEVMAFFSVFWAFFHSSLAPAIEIGGSWPPLGIEILNPWGIPLLNTAFLLSSGAFITYGHHGLIRRSRSSSIDGTIFTIFLAFLFTALQYFEYNEASFSITDSVYGTTFFSSTGLHGILTEAPTKKEKLNRIHIRKVHLPSALKNKKLDNYFLEWLAGFVDSEGNFNISLRNYTSHNNKYNSLILTFQIGLHIDDLAVLEYIKNRLGCGNISISKNRCNFFVNDQASLINIIVPIFKLVELKSSKYYQFLIFEKAVNLIKNKGHLSSSGKIQIIKFYHEIKNSNVKSNSLRTVIINKYWLAGFIDGDGSFSARLDRPVLKFENHVKELPLFNAIVDYFEFGNVIINKPRLPHLTEINNDLSYQTVTLEYNNIHFLKNIIIPIFNIVGANATDNKFKLFKSKKLKDFNDFCVLVNINYYGYHTIPEGKTLANEITSN